MKISDAAKIYAGSSEAAKVMLGSEQVFSAEPDYSAYIVSSLSFTGADDSQTFTDTSGKIWTAHGDAKISGNKGYFDGTGDYISTPDHNDFSFGTGDFTIHFLMNTASIGNTKHVMGQGSLSGSVFSWFFRFNGTGLIFSLGTTVSEWLSHDVVASVSENTEAHIAAIRHGNNLNLYIGGVATGGTIDVTGVTVPDSALDMYIGYSSGAPQSYAGYIDNLQILKGIARWTENFTPPA